MRCYHSMPFDVTVVISNVPTLLFVVSICPSQTGGLGGGHTYIYIPVSRPFGRAIRSTVERPGKEYPPYLSRGWLKRNLWSRWEKQIDRAVNNGLEFSKAIEGSSSTTMVLNSSNIRTPRTGAPCRPIPGPAFPSCRTMPKPRSRTHTAAHTSAGAARALHSSEKQPSPDSPKINFWSRTAWEESDGFVIYERILGLGNWHWGL